MAHPDDLLTDDLTEALRAGRLAHVTTLNPDGSPQTTVVWIGVEDGEIVSAHLDHRRKLRNVERDPRVAISVELGGRTDMGLAHYVVIEGDARVTEGGASELLQDLAHVYLGPDVEFPPGGSDVPGWVLRTRPTKVRGVTPWD